MRRKEAPKGIGLIAALSLLPLCKLKGSGAMAQSVEISRKGKLSQRKCALWNCYLR